MVTKLKNYFVGKMQKLTTTLDQKGDSTGSHVTDTRCICKPKDFQTLYMHV